MRRIVAAAAGLALAALAGTAHADTFVVVPDGAPTVAAAPASAQVPNAPGSLILPPDWETRPTQVRSLPFDELSGLWHQAGAAYGIPWQVLAAINRIESNFGRNMGPSSAGAVGWMQFMPDTWLRWGTDADGDGLADPWNPYDAVYAAARYLAAAGGTVDISRGIFAYNHADWYVREVLDLANTYGGVGGGDVAFRLDRLQVALDEAQERVAGASERLVAARQIHRRLARRERSLLSRAQRLALLSDRLDLQKRAGQLGVHLDAAAARVRRLERQLRRARADLRAAREGTQGAVFTGAGRTLFGTPNYSGGYVFPVGGGPAVVSVGHTHHDYPAADIAAPEGSPLYALANGIVRSAWSSPDGNCGIGLTFDAEDGQTWTYCHMSYLEPAVRAGATLAAGQPIGLVGSTGHATGPHLHLQLQPATSYPQQQAWFASFAGSAFRWQDAPTPERMLSAYLAPRVFAVQQPAPVFAVVPSPATEVVDETVLFTRLGG
ncbi:MAG TPA: peptidoglycan DD-metalloendopeptidase family protein [Gaiellaceae bacterium]|nr:peptidoglycan DD-metalloendopeptidase family protein [Gaiellaceae bacterium]